MLESWGSIVSLEELGSTIPETLVIKPVDLLSSQIRSFYGLLSALVSVLLVYMCTYVSGVHGVQKTGYQIHWNRSYR